MTDLLTRRALVTASRLIEAAAKADHATMTAILTAIDADAMATNGDPVCAVLIQRACNWFHTTSGEIAAGSRRNEATDARAVVCYAAHLLGISYSQIGREIGRDHSSVMAACSRVGQTPRLRTIAQRIAGQLGWDREDVGA